jgi:tetratricopeptide (TPR) repeat protein
LGNIEAAELQFQASLEVSPANTRALGGLARVAAARGDDAEAVDLYEQIVNRSPNPVDVIALGDLHVRAGRDAEAALQYDLVRAIGKLYEANAIRFDLPMILFESDHGDALAALDQAEMAYAERPSIYAADALAWALFRTGRLDEARMRAEEALRFGTPDASFFFHSGMIAAAQGDAAAARTYLQRALALNPEFHVLQAEEARAALEDMSASSQP